MNDVPLEAFHEAILATYGTKAGLVARERVPPVKSARDAVRAAILAGSGDDVLTEHADGSVTVDCSPPKLYD